MEKEKAERGSGAWESGEARAGLLERQETAQQVRLSREGRSEPREPALEQQAPVHMDARARGWQGQEGGPGLA
jgi:hypothetical protein